MKKIIRKCKDCARFNDFAHTYIRDDVDCCSRWHEAYSKSDNKGDRQCCEKFEDKKRAVQLSLF